MMGLKDPQTPPREEWDMKWGNMISILQIYFERSWIMVVGNSVKNAVWLSNQLSNQLINQVQLNS